MVSRLLTLNGLAIIGVLLFHAAGWGFVAMFAWSHRYLPPAVPATSQLGSISYYLLRICEQLAVPSIPTFLFVSGFFIAFATGRKRTTVSWDVVAARIRGLLVPYLIWSILLLSLEFVRSRDIQLWDTLLILLTGRANPAYYYVSLLCQLYLLSPLLVYGAKKYWPALLLITAFIQLAIQALYYPALLGYQIPTLEPFIDSVPKWFFGTRIFWFTFGIVAGFQLPQLKRLLMHYRWALLVTSLLLFPLAVVEWELIQQLSGAGWLAHRETLLDTFYSLTILLTFLAFDTSNDALEKLGIAKEIATLGQKSFGIYLVHSPAMEFAARVLYHVAPFVLALQALFFPLIAIAGLGISLLLMWVVERTTLRGIYKYLFG